MADTQRQMYAYFHEFTPTGDDKIDAILEAVARAVKSGHYAGQWNEADDLGPHGFWSLIQNCANEAAQPRKPLSDEQIADCAWGYFEDSKNLPEWVPHFVRAIEAAHNITEESNAPINQ